MSQIELGVLEEIAFRSLAMSKKTNADLRKMQFILRIPRLHREYISLNGLDPYVEKFTAIVAEYESFMEEKVRQAKQV
jgi:hypothetical protein